MSVSIPKKTRAKARTPIVEMAREIARQSHQPMSIDEIRAKFDPAFPFQVKKVASVRHPDPDCREAYSVGTVIDVLWLDEEHGWYAVGNFRMITPPNAKQWVLV